MSAKTATIANAASLSSSVQIWDGSAAHPESLVAILMPAIWTAATLTFQASYDGTNFFDLYNTNGQEVQPAVAPVANHWVALDPADFISCAYVKVRSGTGASPVTQAQASPLTLVTRRMG